MSYSALINEPPKHVYNATHVRLTTSVKLNEELADYFCERARIEDLYVQNLMKLSKKHYNFNESSMGNFSPLWEALKKELVLSGQIHLDYSKKIAETIEPSLRQSMVNSDYFSQVQCMEQSINKTAREHEDLEIRIQKHKKTGSKGEHKIIELQKQLEDKNLEWKTNAPEYLQALQDLDESRLTLLKRVLKDFGVLLGEVSTRTSQGSDNLLEVAEALSVENEVTHFCSSAYQERKPDVSFDPVPIVLEASHSESSLKQTTSKKKKFFSSIVNIGRKSKHSTTEPNRQRSFSHSDTLIEPDNTHSAQTHRALYENPAVPPLRKAASFSTTNLSQQVTASIVVDSEGYSIPPPDRDMPWSSEGCASFVETEDLSSDAGSLFSSNTQPRIKLDIKNEAVAEEDASNAAVALTRVATLLKEKNLNPSSRRIRGRREVRATQLHSVIEQPPLDWDPKTPEEHPQITVDILEKIHVTSSSGQTEPCLLEGEAVLRYSGPSESLSPVCFKLNFGSGLQLEGSEHIRCISPDVYELVSLNLKEIRLRYQEVVSPLLYVKPVWKFDSEKTRLLVKYQKLCSENLENVSFMTSLGKEVKHAQSIPAGELSPNNDRIKWDLGTLGSSEDMIKAQFEVHHQGSMQPVLVRFDLYNKTLSSFSISEGSDPNLLWVAIQQIKRNVKSGKYTVL